MADGDGNPWPGGIANQTWWFSEQCLSMGGVSGGIYADKPGFHNTVNANLRNWPSNYSVALPILLAGPRDKARAFDWIFPEAQTKNYFRINKYCQLLMDASLARDPRLRGLYEWFGTKDGANIGYNVYKDRPSSSDDTHDWHIHFSWVTAWLLDWAGPQGVISVLRAESLGAYLARGGKLIGQEIDMSLTPLQAAQVNNSEQLLYGVVGLAEDIKNLSNGDGTIKPPLLNQMAALLKEIKEIVSRPVEVTLTDAQLETLADKIAVKVLRPMADAAMAEAAVLDAAA